MRSPKVQAGCHACWLASAPARIISDLLGRRLIAGDTANAMSMTPMGFFELIVYGSQPNSKGQVSQPAAERPRYPSASPESGHVRAERDAGDRRRQWLGAGESAADSASNAVSFHA